MPVQAQEPEARDQVKVPEAAAGIGTLYTGCWGLSLVGGFRMKLEAWGCSAS